jgi:hypothetical protein
MCNRSILPTPKTKKLTTVFAQRSKFRIRIFTIIFYTKDERKLENRLAPLFTVNYLLLDNENEIDG